MNELVMAYFKTPMWCLLQQYKEKNIKNNRLVLKPVTPQIQSSSIKKYNTI